MYTGNRTYLNEANRVWDWSFASGLIDNSYYVYDGADMRSECSDLNRIQWSYNAGVYLYGAAVMWNMTDGPLRAVWENRVTNMLGSIIPIFFDNSTMIEIACEPLYSCNVDQQTFKAYLARWMAASVKVAPFTFNVVMPLLATSAQAAARSVSLLVLSFLPGLY